MTLGEWVREVLLERADGRRPSVIEETLLGEVLALRRFLDRGENKKGAPSGAPFVVHGFLSQAN